jgi:hypothetical protein
MSFTNLDFNAQTIMHSFKQRMRQIPSIHKFTFGLTPIAASFKTAPTNEGIEYGCIRHFELEVCSKTEYMMIGLIEGTNII